MKFVRTALVVMAGALVPLVPTSAHADKLVQNDALSDVVSYSFTGEDETATPVPDRTEGDIAYSTIRHRARKVVLTMRFAELETGEEKYFYYAIRTGKMTRYVALLTGSGHWGGRVDMRTARGKKVSCNVTRAIDYTANTATVRVPRKCLDRPRWVKVGMALAAFDGTADPSSATVFLDDARANGEFNVPRWSPRVYR